MPKSLRGGELLELIVPEGISSIWWMIKKGKMDLFVSMPSKKVKILFQSKFPQQFKPNQNK